ncbi:unnamed protein product [Bemisia tabaci]|uniref:Tesmin/TSO1-like CXC domain-containing protein n=1 Tax=Bemisia tabaci TaxID=7038 RepID=A0A9P0A0Y0_BEMTA|nr:unnamed protein product [Bemisia tabaci]
MEQDTETVCVLCGTLITIDNRVVAKDKALLTLIEASHERDDDRWVEWEVLNASKQSIQVHSTCRKNYTRRNSILAAVKNRPADDVPQCASPIKKKLRVSDHVFNFVENCMFCGLDAGEEFEQKQLKYPKDRRVRVVRVESLEFTHSVYNVAKGRNSDVDKQVMQRLSNVIDLVAEEGRYHYPCYIDFRKHASVSDKETGRPNDPKLEKSMEEIFSFMENSSESQFSLHELLQVPSAFIPTSKTLLKKLKEKYRDDIIFAVQKTKETVVCLKSSLLTAIDRSKEANQTFSIVTFDQPLYLKAREVIAAMSGEEKFKNVFVRLGGFHLCMSFLGCIGFVMAGSGLKEVLSEIYAPLAVDKMLLGHSYSRAVRGHTIVWLALSKMFMSQIEISNQDAAVLAPLLRTFLESPPKLAEATGLPAVHNLSQKLSAVLIQTEGKGPTSKLWCQYYRMVTLLLQFTAAERSGDWQLHLSTIKDMLPFFHATGHFSYAKSSQIQIYLQDMADLESKLSEGELERFVGEGYFTIRRGDKYWSGTWTDMIIEQNLMRAMKSSGGLTRGRGMSDSVIGKWIGAGPLMLRIVHNLENFCQIEVESGEQHHDLRTSFFKREKSVLNKVEVWFQTNDPFPKTDKCISISTGVIGSEHTNCYNAFDVGCKILESIYQKTFGEIKLSRKNIVRNLEMDTGNTFKVHENDITCDPLRLFQRISIFMTSQDNLEEFFKYELSPYPLSLFDTNGMRKTKKASLYAIFEPKLEKKAPSNSTYILDGGFLLHRAVWPQEAEKFGDILENYISYALRNFGRNCVIIFDGYSRDTPSTKNAERFRRYGKSMVNEIAFHEETKVTLIQEKFLSNDENKTRLIEMLQKKFRDIGIENKIADGDADPLIVQTTLNLSLESTQNCVIIGEDIDLLVILTALCPEGTEIFLLKPGRLNVETKLYSSKSLNARPKLKEHVLFLHAFSGCDTNSAIFGKGKMALCNLIEKNEDIQDFAGHFKDKGSTFNSISESGSKILSRLYGANKKNDSLDKFRFHLFKKNSLTGKKNRLESLPPSEDAAKFHSFRAFHQVQLWLGNQLPPKDWGWRLEGTQLAPVHMSLGPAPEKVLNSIFCGCTKGCGKACGCRKSGLKCTNICLNCCGEACENSRELASFEEEEENVDDVEATIDNDHEDKMQDEEPRRDSNCQEREREKEEDETRMMLRSTTSKRRRLF